MHLADTPAPTPRLPSGWRLAAIAYAAAGVGILAACALVPDSDMAMLAAIGGGLPWSLSLLTLELTPGVARDALLLLAIGWGVNAALLWWLSRRRDSDRARPHGD